MTSLPSANLSASALEQELDELLGESVADALARERSAFDRAIGGFEQRLILFGAGNLGRQMLKTLREAGLHPQCFADNRAELWGKTIDDVRVLSPGEAAARHGANSVFIVAIWNDKHRFVETRQTLGKLGCAHVLPVSSLRWKFADRLLPALWEDLPHRLLQRADAVRKAFSLWADRRSCQEYVGQIRWRLHADFDALSAPWAEESYFPSLLPLKDDEVFADCGAFDGDTLRSFLGRRGDRFKKIDAFEPDPSLFGKLQQFLATLPPALRGKIDAMPFAVGARRQRLTFDPACGTFSAGGPVVVESAPLDELLGDNAPTYIKMDIEGAEMDALAGARLILQRHRPALAICVYHRQGDLWDIPSYIHSISDDYRLYLLPHDPDGWQTVCYAVGPDRTSGH